MTIFRALGLCAAAAFLAAPAVQAKSSAKLEYRVTCKDGVTMKPGRGACSHHGGIDAKGKSGVLCTDGTLSDEKAPDMCKSHNGVALKGQGVIGKDDDVKHVDKDMGPNSDKIADGKPGDGKRNNTKEKDYRKADRDAAKKNVTCKDGTMAKGRMGCFGHGGAVVVPADRDARTGAGGDEPGGVTMNPTGATAQCKDGTYSHAVHHTGACSRHGGVDKWLDKK